MNAAKRRGFSGISDKLRPGFFHVCMRGLIIVDEPIVVWRRICSGTCLKPT